MHVGYREEDVALFIRPGTFVSSEYLDNKRMSLTIQQLLQTLMKLAQSEEISQLKSFSLLKFGLNLGQSTGVCLSNRLNVLSMNSFIFDIIQSNWIVFISILFVVIIESTALESFKSISH